MDHEKVIKKTKKLLSLNLVVDIDRIKSNN